MKNLHIIVLAMFCMMTSCRTTPSQSVVVNYFAGEVVCDTLGRFVMTDCATNNNFLLLQGSELQALKDEYKSLARFDGERIFAEVEGNIINMNDTLPTLSVDRLIRFDRDMSCMLSYYVVGEYHVSAGDFTGVLMLNKDYTYECSQADKTGHDSAMVTSGSWHLNAALEMMLHQTSPSQADHQFQVVPPQFSVTSNDGGEPLVYTKVRD